ncbi:MAG: ribosomal protein S18-alanine N-acetyltransferase [Clostridia bacterium]
MGIQIRKMLPTDLLILKPILQTDFDDFWTFSTLESELKNPNSRYLVAIKQDEIVGFAGIWISVDDVHITNIVTKKAYRNQKIASSLLQELITLAKETHKSSLTLEVNEHNIAAIQLYKKYGFQTLGIRKKYYHGTDNAVIMTLPF